MNAYSKDLRLKTLGALDRGMPRKEVASVFGVSLASPGRGPRILAIGEQRRALWEQLEANDDATLERHCELWRDGRGDGVSVATMSRAVRKLGRSRKKDRWEPPSGTSRRGALGGSV